MSHFVGHHRHLIYSERTGAPKGVIRGNRGLANLVHWDMLHRGCEPGKTHLQYASFDLPLKFHPAAVRASAVFDTPIGAVAAMTPA